MTDVEKATLARIDRLAAVPGRAIGNLTADEARTLQRMLAQPRLPAEPSLDAFKALASGWHSKTAASGPIGAYRALAAHLAWPHVDFDALDEARGHDSSDAGASPLNHGRGSKAARGKPHVTSSEPHNCTPAARYVWHLEFALLEQGQWSPRLEPFRAPSHAEGVAEQYRYRSDVACIRVTGPHLHQVPA